tara:strand:+ start:204 stop:866 length:663 start_codon:yes stop_codon:yes gene_type:complete
MMVMHDSDIQKTYEAWYTYQGLYAHFRHEARNYDYFKYHGKLKFSGIESMEKSFRKHENSGNFSMQRKVFKDIGNKFKDKDALVFFYLSQFTNNIMYPSHFDSDVYQEYTDRMNNFYFHLEKDVNQIKRYIDKYEANFDDIFKVDGINHPVILKMGLSKTISIETFCVFDMLLGFVKQIDSRLGDPIWKDQSTLAKKYKPFLEVDEKRAKKIIMDVLMKG